jgi:mannose-6-phosphate isomerase-like protein (cupin superfamily)
MLTVLTAAELLLPPPSRTLEFQGESLDADVSFFVVDLKAGEGPALHRHDYAEVFIPLAGAAVFMTGDDELEAGPDQVIVVGPRQPHGFNCVGEERLRMVCIHAKGRMVTEWLDSRDS